ncbi:uncharacterized protein FOMMEDRAFT_18978 [Fomitiporia mediterranea MF3/22]|uniref:uncharacterized protein n=1 Tax=Fomitiporia mediterranea (strain MF3/22) TaxID=694068 RepID=UPI0004408FB9|nr:uncharacterized protein FOMMEDRAFT_18978 [Fomitiporia mediterranea MF3/22]EJD03575.1 hypothetical protein FOMMEDRAFT_18978 [Fomitiporia mediterranea MF3/22]
MSTFVYGNNLNGCTITISNLVQHNAPQPNTAPAHHGNRAQHGFVPATPPPSYDSHAEGSVDEYASSETLVDDHDSDAAADQEAGDEN